MLMFLNLFKKLGIKFRVGSENLFFKKQYYLKVFCVLIGDRIYICFVFDNDISLFKNFKNFFR